MLRRRKQEIKGGERWQRGTQERGDEGWGEGKRERDVRNKPTVQRCWSAGEDAEKLQERGSKVKVVTDLMCPFSTANHYLLYASGVFHPPLWITHLPSYHPNKCVTLCCVPDVFYFLLYMTCSCALDVASCAYISAIPSACLPPVSLLSHFYRCLYPFFSLHLRLYVVTLLLPLFFFILYSFAQYFFVCAQIWYTVNMNMTYLSPSMLLPFLLGLPTPETGWDSGRSVKHCGVLHVQHHPSLLFGVHQEPEPLLEGGMWPNVPRPCGQSHTHLCMCTFKRNYFQGFVCTAHTIKLLYSSHWFMEQLKRFS